MTYEDIGGLGGVTRKSYFPQERTPPPRDTITFSESHAAPLMIDSENRRDLEKERIALSRSLTERCGPALISQLERPKRRQVAVYKQRLDVVPIDRGVGLKKEPKKQVLSEELVGSQDVNPRAFTARIWIEFQALQRVFG